MRFLLLIVLLLVADRPIHAECIAPGCEEATAVVAAARATARAVLTREAPTQTSTPTPVPTWTPTQTSTPTPVPTWTPTQTSTPTSVPTSDPTVITTPEPEAAMISETVTPARETTQKATTGASPLLVLVGFVLIVIALALAMIFAPRWLRHGN